jgi:hypothetical protein
VGRGAWLDAVNETELPFSYQISKFTFLGRPNGNLHSNYTD